MASKRKQKRDERRKMCEGKAKYDTQDKATDAMRAVRRGQHVNRRRQMTAYRCKFCGSFHFGHTPGDVRRKILKRQAGEL